MQITTLIRGLCIIHRTQPDARVDAQHDTVFAGEHKPDLLSDEERAIMAADGWLDLEDSWGHFT